MRSTLWPTLWKVAVCTVLAAVLAAGSAWAQATEEQASERGSGRTSTILSFDTMRGNPGNGDPANVIRGLEGGGSSWTILHSVHGVLRSNGQLLVIVRGLVVSAPGQDQDVNPVPQFRAALSCQDPADPTQGQLFFTDPVPATTGKGAGDANIVGRVQLPPTCFAPVVLITSPPSQTSPNGVWFAVTGF